MREFSVPASIRVDDGDTLPDAVFALAEAFPDAVAVRRRTDGEWVDVTCAAFVAEIVDVARGLVASGIAPGDRVALLSRTRYEWTLFDYAIAAAGAVTVPVYETSSADQVGWILADSGATAAVVESDRHAAVVAGLDDPPAHVWRIEPGPGWPGAVAELTDRGAAVHAGDGARTARGGPRGRPGHADLHLRHDRSAEGLRADPPQPRQRGADGRDGPARAARRRRLDPAVPAARARVRQDRPVRGAGDAHRARPLPRRQAPARRPRRLPADGPARRAARVREGLQRRAAPGPGRRARAGSSTPRPRPPSSGARHCDAGGPGLRCGCSRACSTRWSTASCAPRWAASSGRRSPAAHRWARGSGTSTAASA